MRSGISAASVGYPSCPSRRLSAVASADVAGLTLSGSISAKYPLNRRDAQAPLAAVALSDGISRQLVPHLDLVPVRIRKEHVRLSGDEFAAMLDLATRALDSERGLVDVARVSEPETEVLDAARLSDAVSAFLKDEDVARAWRLRLEKMLLPIDGEHPEHVVVELERSVQIAHRQGEVGQSERFDHRTHHAISDATPARSASGGFSRCLLARSAGRFPPPHGISAQVSRFARQPRAERNFLVRASA